MSELLLIDPDMWAQTRSGARAGRGFRYQDAVGAWLAAEAWRGTVPWAHVIPEGLDDVQLLGQERDYRAQLKARHDPRGVFSIAEAARHIAKIARSLPPNWLAAPELRLALMLERPVAGVQPSGWGPSLAETPQVLGSIAAALSTELPGWDVQALLTRTHLIIEANPIERGLAALESAELAPAAARLALHRLREVAGNAADANFLAGTDSASMLNRSDVQACIESVREVIDPAGYIALTGGLCDLADFSSPLTETDFYQGVNVAPGHVGAGLVFPRPELTAEVLAGIEKRRFALVAGPSGAGKSALAWLAAYHSRHVVRWYRVRSLAPSDAPRLTQLARLLEATAERPVGFVVEDVGRVETAGWDVLVREIESNAGMIALATVREEDIFLLSSAARTPTVRPSLDEALAERIWQALKADGKAVFAYWREPYDQSRGLLLEYTHLLTAGARLEETVREQVRRRLAEGRGDELRILRAVAFATAHGATVDRERLRHREGLDEVGFAAALKRLIDEHALLVRDDGTLTGLHEIRSHHLDLAVREILGEARQAAIVAAIETVRVDAFAPFIVRLLRGWPEQEAPVLDALATRLSPHEPAAWAPIFHGLGLATADRVAERWLEISRDNGIDDRVTWTAFLFALSGSDLGDDPRWAPIKTASAAFANVAVPDLRRSAYDRLNEAPLPKFGLAEAHSLVASLLPLKGATAPPGTKMHPDPLLANAELGSLLAFVSTVREVGLEPARAVVEAVGGTDALLERIYQETPWATRPTLGEVDGVPSVTGYLRFVTGAQSDPNAAVVRLCEQMAAAAPAAELVISDVLFTGGRSAGWADIAIAAKKMPRRSLPAPARVAWSRAQIRAVQRLVAAPTETGRLTSLAQTISELQTRLVQAADFYCRGETPSAQWRLYLQAVSWLTNFIQPPGVDEKVAGPLELGTLADNDDPHAFASGVLRLTDELTDGVSKEPQLMAVRTADLARTAAALLNPARWRMTSDAPLQIIAEMRSTLWDIRAILGQAAADPDAHRRAALRAGTTSRHHSALPRAADTARAEAHRAEQTRCREVEAAFAARGLVVEVYVRSSATDSGWAWPDVEFATVMRVTSFVQWLTCAEMFVEISGELALPLYFGAAVAGWLAPLGMHRVGERVFPEPKFGEKWAADLPYPLVQDGNLARFVETSDAISTFSAALADRSRPLNEAEDSFLGDRLEVCRRNIQALMREVVENPEDEQLTTATAFLVEAFQRVAAEIELRNEGPTLAADIVGLVDGRSSEFTLGLVAVWAGLMDRAARLPLPGLSEVAYMTDAGCGDRAAIQTSPTESVADPSHPSSKATGKSRRSSRARRPRPRR